MAKAGEVLDRADEVVGELEGGKKRAVMEVGDPLQAVLMQVDAAQRLELLEPLDLCKAVALEPERAQARPLVEALDALKATVVQVQLVVQRRRVVQLLFLRELPRAPEALLSSGRAAARVGSTATCLLQHLRRDPFLAVG